jgi:hypothetical protein
MAHHSLQKPANYERRLTDDDDETTAKLHDQTPAPQHQATIDDDVLSSAFQELEPHHLARQL